MLQRGCRTLHPTTASPLPNRPGLQLSLGQKLGPARSQKSGAHIWLVRHDLPIAFGILAATDQPNGAKPVVPPAAVPRLDDYIVVWELGLEGDVRPVQGNPVHSNRRAKREA